MGMIDKHMRTDAVDALRVIGAPQRRQPDELGLLLFKSNVT